MSKESLSDNQRIAKNTLLLYCRMFISLVVGLYTSRVVLNSLGFSDYGIYNVVGGLVASLSFLNNGMASASQRFISYEMGKKEGQNLNEVFCTSVLTHLAISVVIFLLLESFGIWFLNCKLNIPDGRLMAANWVFQCSLVTLALTINSVPYNSCIIAHEHMNIYAYISILEVTLKLLIALAIVHATYDKLIVYCVLFAVVQFIIRLINVVYCKRHFKECRFKMRFNKELFQRMFAFAGWSCVGNMGFTLKDQGSNIILNLFFGTTVNAARGIATQVNGIVNSFSSNFIMAMNPQITKLHAAGNEAECQKLAYAGSKFSFFLLSLIAIPFLINRNYVLRLWLGAVPDYTDIFVLIILLTSLIYSMSGTITTVIFATGRVRTFQVSLAVLLLMELPIAYIILYYGGEPYEALLPALLTNFLSLLLRIRILHKIIPSYKTTYYLWNTIVRCILIFSISYGISWYIRSLFTEGLLTLIVTSALAAMVCLTVIFCLGLSKSERNMVLAKVRKIGRHAASKE